MRFKLKTPIDKKQTIQYKKYWHEEVRTDKIGIFLEPERQDISDKVTIISIIKLYIALLNQEGFHFFTLSIYYVVTVLTHIS
jgi:hypothetical protein